MCTANTNADPSFWSLHQRLCAAAAQCGAPPVTHARLCDQASKAGQGAHQESTFALACEDQLEADL